MLFDRRHKPSFFQKFSNFMLPKKGIKRAYQYIWYRVMRISATPHSVALGFACGAFASFTPFLGFHFLIAAAIAFMLRSSMISSAFGTAVGNPITFPFILPATYEFGNYLLGVEPHETSQEAADMSQINSLFGSIWEGEGGAIDQLVSLLKPMLVGGIPMGIACGIVCYAIVKPAIQAYQNARRRKITEQMHDKGPVHHHPKARAIRERGKQS